MLRARCRVIGVGEVFGRVPDDLLTADSVGSMSLVPVVVCITDPRSRPDRLTSLGWADPASEYSSQFSREPRHPVDRPDNRRT